MTLISFFPIFNSKFVSITYVKEITRFNRNKFLFVFVFWPSFKNYDFKGTTQQFQLLYFSYVKPGQEKFSYKQRKDHRPTLSELLHRIHSQKY